MNLSKEYDSLNRRLLFAGNFKSNLFRLCHVLTEKSVFYRLMEFCAQICFDSVESIKTISSVPHFGRPNVFASKFQGKVKQHPKYRTYYQDNQLNSTVGMLLGVDIIKNGNGFYAVDLNLNAGLYKERRKLFDTDIDPIFLEINSTALEYGYTKIVCFADSWSSDHIEDLKIFNNKNDVDLVLSSPNYHGSGKVIQMLNIPEKLDPDTLYVVFNFQHSPLDFYITNQSCTSHWLNQGIKNNSSEKSFLKCVDSYDRLSDVEFEDNGGLPNLVIKLGGGWGGQFVKIARIEKSSGDKIGDELTEDKIVSLFNRSIYTRMRGWAGQHHKLLFQKFIPPETDINGHPQIIRALLLISPVTSKLLSCHRKISDYPFPENVPCGLVEDDRPFIINFSRGHYESIAGEEKKSVEQASLQLCDIIFDTLKGKFVIENSPQTGFNNNLN